MIVRLLVAIFGAVAITIGLFLFMNDVSNRFVLRDSTQYFAITDFIRAPDRGRQLPEIPVVPEATPERPQLEFNEEELLPAELTSVVPDMEGIVPTEDQLPVLRETESP